MTPQPRFTVRQFIAAVGFGMGITCVLAVLCYPTRIHQPDLAVMLSGIPIFLAGLCVRTVRPSHLRDRVVRWLYFIAVGMVYLLTVGIYACMMVVRDTLIFQDHYWPRSVFERAYLILTVCLVATAPFALVCFGFVANHLIRHDSTPQKRPDPAAAYWSAGSGI